MKVYLSGPITGLEEAAVRKAFAEAEAEMVACSQETVSPLCNGLDYNAAWNEHMLADIKMLLECEAIYMMEGWQASAGARIERAIADETGMMVLHQNEMRRRWRLSKAIDMAFKDIDVYIKQKVNNE